jgi:predicted transcriptional regulator YdeE
VLKQELPGYEEYMVLSGVRPGAERGKLMKGESSIRRLLFPACFLNDLTGYEPRIVDLEKPITIIGMSVDTTLKSIYRDVPRLGKQFKELKEAQPIPNTKEPWAFAAVSRGYDPATGAMTYMMGDVVTSAAEVPEGMSAFEIPAITYAIFPVRPKNKAGWGMAIANAKGYAYTACGCRSRGMSRRA